LSLRPSSLSPITFKLAQHCLSNFQPRGTKWQSQPLSPPSDSTKCLAMTDSQAAKPRITASSFINFSNIADMASDLNRNAVASHAAKIGRQRRRKKRLDDGPESVAHRFMAWRSLDWPASNSPQEGGQHQQVSDEESEQGSAQTSTALARRLPPPPPPNQQPLNILGQGRRDPFASYAVPDVPMLVHEVVDHGTMADIISLRS
jgi:hypothetical protein